jgi:hypothetical protein
MYVEMARSTVTGFQVRVMDPASRMTRMFTYPTIDHARRAASEWASVCNCGIVDKCGA